MTEMSATCMARCRLSDKMHGPNTKKYKQAIDSGMNGRTMWSGLGKRIRVIYSACVMLYSLALSVTRRMVQPNHWNGCLLVSVA